MDLDKYIQDVKALQARAEEFDEDAPGAVQEKIKVLTKAHTLAGRVSAQMDADYAKIYAFRKITYAQAKDKAKTGDKANAAELAIINLRMAEAQAKGLKSFWNNEFKSIAETIYELRLRVRVDMHTLGGGD
ncbi:hypothetical protein [Paenibacillus sp. P32E]|uniref:hypothetical protein n=1 Tax=Paenibacillus sp. P32E TaxID=1349434 RepID=UPI00094043C6|nr:hypothetical protein [Paenibacillus sp. P32E]OKP94790.1 hypothetical protein A3848_02115 [Paenibacillus sp. P32E]